MAPSVTGLQCLIDAAFVELEKLCLNINANKSSYIVFRKSKRERVNYSVCIAGKFLTPVNSCKYLGVCISEDLSLDNDVDRVTNSFLKQFNGFYSKS